MLFVRKKIEAILEDAYKNDPEFRESVDNFDKQKQRIISGKLSLEELDEVSAGTTIVIRGKIYTWP